ncbi:hypothetical protein BDY24DRAFT_379347 [Mrakia frigida]|uniref:uncharacterized protein n=1 Tax=Mrakia frigida TaxID=29902 RepID=UPI003FCC230E
MEASSSRLPSYTPPSKDAISIVPSLSALHPDPTHPAHSALLLNLDLKKDSVKIFSFSQGGIILCPEEVRDSSRASVEQEESWAKAGGYLQVVSTQRKIVPQISVKIVARQSLSFPQDRGGSREEDEVFAKEVVLKDVQLEKGLNSFEFLLALPHSAPVHAGSTRDRKAFATLFHYAIGTVSGFKGFFGSKDLVAEEQVYVVAAPSMGSSDDSLRLALRVEGHTEELGPCSLEASSSHFMVAGPLRIFLSLHSPPPTLRVYAIKVYIEQKGDLTSFRFRPTKTTRVLLKGSVLESGWKGPYGSNSLSRLLQDGREGEEMLFDASVGDAWTFEQVARIPDDMVLRPSTYPQTDTSIRISSELVVDLYFTLTPTDPPSTPTKVMIASVLRQPVFLAGCGCLPDRLSLPNYTPRPEVFVPIEVRVPCKCDEPTEKLLDEEKELLSSFRAAALGSSLPLEGNEFRNDASASLGRKVGEAY